ncbi:hypothetical protein Q5752_002251 [Cryptotrichosporon argae]
MAYFLLGQLIYIPLLLTNAIAILNEERFLAKIGLSTRAAQTANAGFGHAPAAGFDAFGAPAAADGASFKAKAINLISAVRTLMRLPLIVINILVIIYELVLG